MTSVIATLNGIYDKHGVLTPSLVVDTARPVGAPLHDRFEWDDAVAGEEYRKVQAGQLIRSVKIRFDTGESRSEPMRAFLPVRVAGSGPAEFVPAVKALGDPVSRELVLKDFRRILLGLRSRYSQLEEYSSYVKEVLLDGVS